MIAGEAQVVTRADAAHVLDFVSDLARYRDADHKVGRVLAVDVDGDDLVVRFRPRLRGLPGPAVRQRITRTAQHRLDITSEPSWQDRVVRFRGSVVCEPVAGGTRVTHREEFEPARWVRPLWAPVFGRWLAADVRAEVVRLGRLLDAEVTAGRGDADGVTSVGPHPGARSARRTPTSAGSEGPAGPRVVALTVRVLAGVALASGLTGIVAGPGALPTDGSAVGPNLDSQYRFVNAFWLAVAPLALTAVTDAERGPRQVRGVAAAVFVGGVARLVAWRRTGRPHPVLIAATAVELAAWPALGWISWRRDGAAPGPRNP